MNFKYTLTLNADEFDTVAMGVALLVKAMEQPQYATEMPASIQAKTACAPKLLEAFLAMKPEIEPKATP